MVLEKVISILAEQFDVAEGDITSETEFINDLNADSLDLVDLVMSLEDEFEIEFGDEDVSKFKTVDDVVKYIEKLI